MDSTDAPLNRTSNDVPVMEIVSKTVLNPESAPASVQEPSADEVCHATSTDAANFGLRPRSRGRSEDVAPTYPAESWQPTPQPTSPVTATETGTLPKSLLDLCRATDRALIAMIVLVSAVLGLFVISQAVTFINHLAQSPVWVQWVGGAALLSVLIAIAASTSMLVGRYLRLSQTPAVWLDRLRLRELAGSATIEAKQKLEHLLREFPIDRDPPEKWIRLGFSLDAQQTLARAKTELLNSRHGHTHKWLNEYDELFLHPLDDVAQQRVKHYAKLVGLKTAVAPAGFLDAAIVLVNSYLLLAELCDIYHVRAGRLGTLRLLLRVGLNTVVSGNLDQQTEVLEDGLRESIQDWTTGLVAQAVGKVVAKAAEGGANALLIYRVGRATIRELRPLRLT